jgi:hypothetical protein
MATRQPRLQGDVEFKPVSIPSAYRQADTKGIRGADVRLGIDKERTN